MMSRLLPLALALAVALMWTTAMWWNWRGG